MDIFSTSKTRLGFHYYPDATHYRDSDLHAWVPELRALGASWLVLVAPPDRAIPEPFVHGLKAAGVEPILHFHLPPSAPPSPEDMRLLFQVYAGWGVRYAALFDRPNRRRSWSVRDWAQSDLVERFTDLFKPLAETALESGLTPVFPPLEPGGDYWDTAFLRSALASIHRRGGHGLLQKMALGAYAWADNLPLNWGAGGPERWPGARPYYTPPGEEDQRGFRIFAWYQAIARAATGASLPLLLLGTGCHIGDQIDPLRPAVDAVAHAERNLALARLLLGDPPAPDETSALEALPAEVLAGNFWLLTAAPESPHQSQAWFRPDGSTLPVVGALRQWIARRGARPEAGFSPTASDELGDHPISHYLLLPSYEWGVADWHLEVIRPFVKKYRPTVGFSLNEAAHARRVTVIGGPQSFPEETLEQLRSAGCTVARISGDGTSIASQLAQL